MKKVLTIFTCFIFLAGMSDTFAQVGGQVPIAPNSIPQFVDPLPHFAYPGARVDATGPGTQLTVSMEPFQQVALSTGTVVNGGVVGTPGVGLANVWAYKISDGTNTYGPLWPAFTIETQRDNALQVHYVNNLFNQTYESVGLIVDETLHWAMVPDFDGSNPPAVVHLHGGEVPSESDGGPDAWFTPGLAETGPSWGMDGTDDFYDYPNTQEGATLWFHDHTLGATRLNVYAGLAGFYFLRDPDENTLQLPGWSGDNLVQEVDPVTGLNQGAAYLPEIEVVIQDRMFDTDGKLYFVNNMPTNPLVHPFWNPEFIGDIITVNGKTWPYLSVAPRMYRFRFLNGSNSRFYELWLQDLATGAFGPVINQIGTDGGLLDAPVAINPALGGKLILAPGERADIVIDFSTMGGAGSVWTLKNSGRAPYPKGGPPKGSTVGRIMQFVVNGTGTEGSQLPVQLRTPPGLVKLTNFAGGLNVTPDLTRKLTLNEVMGPGGPLEVLVNNTKWDANGMGTPGLGETELPVEGSTEVWQIINLTADAHPIHLHLVQFQLVSRQNFNVNKYNKAYNALFPGGVFDGGGGPPMPYDFYYNPTTNTGWKGGNPDITPYLQGPVKPANLNERGWKDTFIMYPGEVTTVVVRFTPTDVPAGSTGPFAFDPKLGPGYVWHCHIIDHEDNEMMRPYKVVAPTLPKSGTLADALPSNFELKQNYPNPFNPSTVINFSVPKENTLVTLKVYNSLGEEIGTLINQVVPAGQHQVNFDATGLSSGVYFYTISAGSFVDSKKMVVMK